MNTLTGHISTITTDQGISLVQVLASGHTFYSIILDTQDTSPWLKEGSPVRLLFKETEVMIALPSPGLQISVRNQIPCRITAINRGVLLCELTLSTPADEKIRSIITRAACEALNLKENDPIIALIKTNEVSLAHD
ncbi:MAG TPA: TOBE domain-containing protein [Puia sp.]